MTPTYSTPSAATGSNAAPTVASSAPQIHAHVAGLAEAGEGATRELLEFLRGIVDARAMALLFAGGREADSCIVTTRGLPASTISALATTLRGTELILRPAPAAGGSSTMVGVPIVRNHSEMAWLLAILGTANMREVAGIATLLQAFAGFILYREERHETERIEVVAGRMSELLEIVRRVGVEEDFQRAARVAVDGVATYLGCKRVILGLRLRGSLHIRAISGVARVDAKSPSNQPIEAAMREAMRSGHKVDFRVGDEKRAETLAHEILLEEVGAVRLVTLPLPAGHGAVMLEWDTEPDAAGSRLVDATAPFLPSLFDLVFRARPNAAVFAIRRWWREADDRRRKVVMAAAAGVVLLLALPLPYRIGADCRLAPTVKRVVAAPFDGQLRKSRVQPGDHVIEGQVLAEMDNRDIRLREAELTAQRERALKQRDRAMSNSGEGADFAAAQVADFEARSVSEELALVQRKIEMLEVKAPLAGVVLSGDLRRDEGRPVQQGQILFEVGPLEQMIVEIEVPDHEISHVRAEMPVSVRLEAGGSRDSRVARIHPQSEARDGKNVFICEAPMDHTGELRPGMRGRVKITADRRPVIWILGHRLWDWLVTTLWW